MQIDKSTSGSQFAGGYMRVVYSTVCAPAAVGAGPTIAEQTITGQDINVGETGFCFIGTPATNQVRAVHVRCTTAGSAIISFLNPTAGGLTPTAASASAPYIFVLFGGN